MFPYPKKASVGMGYAGAKIGVYLFFCRGLGVSCPRYRNVKPEGLLIAKGRPRKPTKLKILEGNRGRRPLSRNEPEYEPTVPKPSDLSPLASEWWDHVVPQLVRLGLAQSVDLHSLVITAEDYAEWDLVRVAGRIEVGTSFCDWENENAKWVYAEMNSGVYYAGVLRWNTSLAKPHDEDHQHQQRRPVGCINRRDSSGHRL